MEEAEKLLSDILIELKNKAELMLDLAYSALVLQSKDIASEIVRLEEYFDWLHNQFQTLVLALYSRGAHKAEIIGLIRLGYSLENIADAATKIATAILRGLEVDMLLPILRPAMEAGEEFVSVVRIGKGSPVANKPLGKALEDVLDVQVLAVRRGDKWYFDPKDDFVLRVGDILLVRGYSEALDDLRELTKTSLEDVEEIEEMFHEEAEED